MGIFNKLNKIVSSFSSQQSQPAVMQPAGLPKHPRVSEGIRTPEHHDLFPELPYDLVDLPCVKWAFPGKEPFFRYLLEKKNADRALIDAGKINLLLSQANELVPLFPSSMEILTLQFVRSTQPGSNETHYCRLEYKPLTATGKHSKYPLTLHFETDQYLGRGESGADNVFGEIHYTRNGDIGKANINCWRRGIGFHIEASERDGELKISYIRTSNSDGEKHKLYDYRVDK